LDYGFYSVGLRYSTINSKVWFNHAQEEYGFGRKVFPYISSADLDIDYEISFSGYNE